MIKMIVTPSGGGGFKAMFVLNVLHSLNTINNQNHNHVIMMITLNEIILFSLFNQ